MTPAARLSAAIEVLADIEARRRPASDALKDWGLSHRFAGSGDRAGIAGLVYDALRRRSSSAALSEGESARGVLLGALRLARGWSVERITSLCTGERFAPEPLSPVELASLARDPGTVLAGQPAWIAGDYPEWMDAELAAAFGDERVPEARALATRAPVDLRVNTLKAGPAKALAALEHLGATPSPLSPVGLRIALGEDARAPAVQAEPAFQKGWIEIQDEGSQLAAQLASVEPGMQVVDLCAGGGGKTLALAAIMDNRGQVFATDSDKRRLAPIFERLTRAGARNVQVRAPRSRADEPVADLSGRADVVLVDAPCTGSGTWRRNPDAKWRVRPNSLEDRITEQHAVLSRAVPLVRPGGRIVYVTCSVLPSENDAAVERFLSEQPDCRAVPPAEAATVAGLEALAAFPSVRGAGIQMSPRRSGTDGFFVAVIRRKAPGV